MNSAATRPRDPVGINCLDTPLIPDDTPMTKKRKTVQPIAKGFQEAFNWSTPHASFGSQVARSSGQLILDRSFTHLFEVALAQRALYLIARLCGPQHAIRTAKIHILSDHSEGQLPFAVITPRVGNTDAVIADCQNWIAENYACQNPVASMIAHSGLKPRTFARRRAAW